MTDNDHRNGPFNGFSTTAEYEESTQRLSRKMAQEMAEQEALREARIKKGVPALEKLVDVAQGGSGQCHYIRRFLLGLFNGQSWPFDMTQFRGLDTDLQLAVLDVIELDWCGHEVHIYLENGEELFQAWWEQESSE